MFSIANKTISYDLKDAFHGKQASDNIIDVSQNHCLLSIWIIKGTLNDKQYSTQEDQKEDEALKPWLNDDVWTELSDAVLRSEAI